VEKVLPANDQLLRQTQPWARDAVAACINACVDCALTCNLCADACLGEADVADLADCIRHNYDCASICSATADVLGRHGTGDRGLIMLQLQTCIEACRISALEATHKHAGPSHCSLSIEACGDCEDACRTVMDLI
jgi:hypothetical protein